MSGIADTVGAGARVATMSTTVDTFEQRARAAEASHVPMFLKLGRIVVRVLYVIVMVIVVILMMAFVLRLFGASTDAAFTRWVYRNAESAMRPFRGIFPTRELGDVSVLDVSLLFGAFMYLLIAIGFDAAFHSLSTRLERKEYEVAQARAQADAARYHLETQTLEAQQALARQVLAQQLAAQDAELAARAAANEAARHQAGPLT
jgi:uncharacterized protein YggT (Ycf19 family)